MTDRDKPAPTPYVPPPIEPHRLAVSDGLMLYRRLMERVAEVDRKRLRDWDNLTEPEAIRRRQTELRQHFIDSLGGLPERTPLNARVTNRFDHAGQTVEAILFESLPNFYVSAALFLPDPSRHAPPWPGVVVVCGHSEIGKGYDTYSKGCMLAAHNGMAALIVDPVDQGERMQIVNPDGSYPLCLMAGHNRLGACATPVGWSTGRFMLWDNMRAIDYLQSRDDIDAGRIGVTGNSGGGTQSSHLVALDDRVACAAPSCYITTYIRELGYKNPPDAEQCIYGQLGYGMDKAEYTFMRAPAPVRVCAAVNDTLFSIEGARESVALARTVLERLDAPDAVELVEDDVPHRWSPKLRTASIEWMNRHLRGADAFFDAPDDLPDPPPPEQLQATPKGQTLLIEGARSGYDLVREEAARLAEARRRRGALSAEDLRTAVRRRAVIRPLAELPAIEARCCEEIARPWGEIRKVLFEIEPDLVLPALHYRPHESTGAPAVVVDGRGKAICHDEAEAMAKEGRAALAVDLRCFGETESSHRQQHGCESRDECEATLLYLLGRTLVGERAEDILVCARWLSEQYAARPVELIARNWAVTPALHARAAEPEAFAAIAIEDRPMTWTEAIERGERARLSDLVPGALIDYDLGELGCE